MKAKNLLLTLAVGAMAISCNNSGSMTQTSASLKTTADSASFYIGYMYGSGLQQMGFSEVNREALIAGLNSAIAKKEVGKDPREIQMFLNGFMQEVAMKKATENAEKGNIRGNNGCRARHLGGHWAVLRIFFCFAGVTASKA